MAFLNSMTSTVTQRVALLPPHAVNDRVALAAAAEPSLALACDSSTADDVIHAVCRAWCAAALRSCSAASSSSGDFAAGGAPVMEERAAAALVVALPRVGLDPPDALLVSKTLSGGDEEIDSKPSAVNFDAAATAAFVRRNAAVDEVCPGALSTLVDNVFSHAVTIESPSTVLGSASATVTTTVSALATCCAVATNSAPGRLLVSTLSSWIVSACASDLRRETSAGACVRTALVNSFSSRYGTARRAIDGSFNAAVARSLRLEVLSASVVALTTNAGTALAGRTSVVECIAHQAMDDASSGDQTDGVEWFAPLAGDVELLLRAGRSADLELRSTHSAAPSAVGSRDVDLVTSLGVPSCDAPAFASAFADAACRINLRAVLVTPPTTLPALRATTGWAGRVLGPLMRHSVDSCRRELRWALDASNLAPAAPTVLIANSHAWPQRLAKSCIHGDAITFVTPAPLRRFLTAKLPVPTDIEPADDVASLAAALAKLVLGTRLAPSATRTTHESRIVGNSDGRDVDSQSQGASRTYAWLPAWTTAALTIDAGGTFAASLLEIAVLMAAARLQKSASVGGASVPISAATLARSAALAWDQACAKVESMFGGSAAASGPTAQQEQQQLSTASRTKAAAALGLEGNEEGKPTTSNGTAPESGNTPSPLTCSWIAAALASLVLRRIVTAADGGGADVPQITVDWAALAKAAPDAAGDPPLGWAAVHSLRCPLDVTPGGGRRRVGGATDAKAAAARSEAAMVRALKQAPGAWSSASALATSCGVPAEAAERVLAALSDRGFCEKQASSGEWRYVA
jgi:hypothetical protein